jgi:cell division protein FtsQ
VVVGYVVFALVYANNKRAGVVFNDIDVRITNAIATMHKDDISLLLAQNGLNYFGKTIKQLPLAEMESVIEQNPLIKRADVYASMDGIVHVDIEQRTPVLRVYDKRGGDFYIDDEGYVFYIKSGQSCYVPIVSGNLKPPFHKDFTGSIHSYMIENKVTDSTLLLLYEFGLYVSKHPFWNAQIEQIYFDAPHRVELVPRVGAHIIKMGTLSNYKYKMNKLLTLYHSGLPLKGWNTYKSIDLSYGNQIICKKNKP